MRLRRADKRALRFNGAEIGTSDLGFPGLASVRRVREDRPGNFSTTFTEPFPIFA